MKKYIILSLTILVLSFVVGFSFYNPIETKASVSQGSQYQSSAFAPKNNANTTYLQSAVLATTQPSTTTPAQGSFTLGSIVLTGTSTGSVVIYNATTSDVTLRAGATTTLTVLASMSGYVPPGTYTFDLIATQGIVVEWTGNVATSTVTWR